MEEDTALLYSAPCSRLDIVLDSVQPKTVFLNHAVIFFLGFSLLRHQAENKSIYPEAGHQAANPSPGIFDQLGSGCTSRILEH